MKKLYSYLGGSDLYGLPKTDTSDSDYYLISTSKLIKDARIYPNPKIHQKKRFAKIDVEQVELCSFLSYLMNGHVFQVESLFVPEEYIEYCSSEFRKMVLERRDQLINQAQVVENVAENVSVVRARTVKDIEKIRQRVLANKPSQKIAEGINRIYEDYQTKGYYHKDYLHNIRVVVSTQSLVKNGFYSLNFENFNKEAFRLCCDIKNNPDAFSRQELDTYLVKQVETLCLYDVKEENSVFNNETATEIMDFFYR